MSSPNLPAKLSAPTEVRPVANVPAWTHETGNEPPVSLHPLRSLKRRWPLALAFFAVLAGAAALFIVMRVEPVYVSEATVLVSPNFLRTLSDDNERSRPYDSFVQQQVHTVTRFDIVLDAIREMERRKVVWREPDETEQEAAERLIEALEVSRIGGTYQISISLAGADPQGHYDALNVLAETFVSKARQEEFYGTPERLETLEAERKRLESEINTRSVQQKKLGQSLGLGTPAGGSNPYNELLVKSMTDLNVARQKRLEAEAQIRTLKGGDAGERSALLQVLSEELVAGDPGLGALKSTLNQRRSAILSQISGLSPSHPVWQRSQAELAEIDAQLKQATDNLAARASTRLVEKLNAEVERSRYVETQLERQVASQSKLATQSAEKLGQVAVFSGEVERMRAQLNAIDDRIRYLTLEQGSPGYLRLFSKARPPIAPEKDRRKKLAVAALFAAALASVGLVTILDLIGGRIHSPNDIERIMKFPPMGCALDTNGKHPAFAADRLQRLSLAVERAARLDGVKSFVLTSILPGGGTSTIAVELQERLSRLGLKVLRINAGAGTASVQFSANGEDELSIPAFSGRGFAGPFDALHDHWSAVRQKYDLVLVDAQPILISADTEYLSRLFEATLLVVEAGRVTGAELKRAARLLSRLRVPAVGVILNRLNLDEDDSGMREDWRQFSQAAERGSTSNTIADLSPVAKDA